MTDHDKDMLRQLYERFNARAIEDVLVHLAEDVIWANGMEGGYVHGRDGVRDYWTRQWAVISPYVEPVAFQTLDAGILVEVLQSVRDLQGKLIEGQSDRRVGHLFHLRGGKVARFDIRNMD